MQEVWKDIDGYNGKYQVSNFGRVKKLQHEYTDTHGSGRHRIIDAHIVTASVAKVGYYMVDLYFNGRRKRCYVHRLVAQAFIPNPYDLPQVNHKDENKLNNAITNLEWCTPGYNVRYGNGRTKSVITRRKNGTYENISEAARKHLSDSMKGKKKSALHRQHISEGRKRMFEERYKNQCKKDG